MSIKNLLEPSALPFEAPNFTAFSDDDFLPAVKEGIARARKNIEAIKNNPEAPSFANVIVALETAEEELSRATSMFYNLLYTHTNDKKQALSQEIGPLSASFANDVLLDEALFQKVDMVYQQRENLGLSIEDQTLLKNTWLGFTRNGAKLSGNDKDKLREIDSELSTLSPQFSQNVLKSKNDYELIIDTEKELQGLPDTVKELAAESAEAKGYKGKWRFGLDAPSYIGILTHADDRALRETMWRANCKLAFDDPNNNRVVAKRVLELRHKRAQLLGYSNHAEFVLERRMAKTPTAVMTFIERILDKALPKAKEDLKLLQNFAKELDGVSDVRPWDIMYYSEKLKKKLFDISDQELRPYFSLDNVIKGMFLHAEKLYGLDIHEVKDGKYPVYHEDVRVFEVFDKASKEMRALYYLDIFPRASKKDGAWENILRAHGLDNGEIKKPIVINVCNFTKPTKDKPSLLSHYEVETLFHEFGHGLHDILCATQYHSTGTRGVLWDFIELPSQMNEQWTVEAETLSTFAKHYKTGEVIPDVLIEKLKKSRNFMTGWGTCRQMAYSKLDMLWHITNPEDIKDIHKFEKEAMKAYDLLNYEDSCMTTSFSHVFAGAYSAGYYSYMWAEVLDADAFEAFKEKGLYDPETASKFRTLLERGGSVDPMVLFVDFRGREPDETPLLKRKGLIS